MVENEKLTIGPLSEYGEGVDIPHQLLTTKQ